MNNKVYPFHDSLKNILKTVDSPLVAMTLIRKISLLLDVSHVEVEIILHLASQTKAVSFNDLCDIFTFISKDQVKRLVSRLAKNEIISLIPIDDDHGNSYRLTTKTFHTIKLIDKESLEHRF